MRKLKSGSDLKGGAKTRSYTPFTTRTTTPKKQPSPQLHNSDIPRTQLEDKRIAPRPLADWHGHATQARLTEKLKKDTSLQRFADKRAYLHFINERAATFTAANTEAHEIFLNVLKDICGLPGITGTKAGAMQGIGMLCVMEAALQACANDPAAASRALCCLRNVDLLASIRVPERLPASVAKPGVGCPAAGPRDGDGCHRFNEQDLALAWKIAQELEATPAGFAALKALTLHDAVAPGAHPDIERHDDMMLHAYLQACREKCRSALRQGLSASPAPYSMASLDGEPATVLDKGIGQIRKRLGASHAHLLNQAARPFAYQAQPGEHEWAIGFILNGLYTDEHIIDGKPTAYARIEGRLNKVAIWCERATSGNGRASTAWRKAVPYLLPGHGKSPLHAYNSLEAGRGLRQCGVAMENATQGVIHDGRALRDQILGNIIKALKASGGDEGRALSTQPGGNSPNPSENATGNLARLALLMETVSNTAPFPTLLHGAAPDRYTVERARERIYTWLAGGEAGQTQATRDAVERALSAAARPLTLDRLQQWASALPGSDVRDAVQAAGGESPEHRDLDKQEQEPGTDRPDWAAYARAVRQLHAGAGDPVPAPHLEKLDEAPDKLGMIGEVIEGAAARMELGSKLSYASGGFAGAGAREVTRLLGTFLSFGLVRPRVDASVVRKREAVLEMETAVDGNQIFVGTRRSVKMQAGGGVGIGPGVKIRGVGGFKAGASLDVFTSVEHPATHGVKLSLPRPGGMAADRDSNLLLGRLFRKYVIERRSPELRRDHAARAPGRDGESTLKNLLQACPTLCVGLLDTTERIMREGVSAAGGASVSAGPLSAGLSAGISVEKAHAQRLSRDESRAALNVIKSSHGTSHTAALTGQIHALQQAGEMARALAGTSAPSALPARTKQAAGSLLNAMCVTSKEIGSWGSSGSYTLVIENGAIGNGSRSTIMHRDAESLIASVAPKLDRWAIATANRFQKEKVNGGDTHRQDAYDRAYAMLRAQLDDARRNGDAQTRYTEIFELTAEALESATALRSAMMLFERAGNREQAAALSKKLDALLASDAAWMPHLLFTQRTSRADTSAAVQFGIYAGRTNAVASSSLKSLG
ncbi:hypothetical protein RY831_21110 [Noviherbaspirillum sp. CPCC 100848]|uniref:Type III effector protein n=1 Tax=Noviherbaspirillum album TaxID=3080276 RepID=A0ABU6JDF7_9BURK|nr:hypothetical protein [Noviherbaspirillum sp. CPCC 100848]MEC4721672.1 hypothetical protein [Noviherbaspirillum sp. CPCC 100848]